MNTKPAQGHALPGIVVESLGDAVRMRFPDDSRGFLNNYPIHIEPGFQQLEAGDFVLVGINEVRSDGIQGVVIAVLAPHFILDRGEWETTFS